jgi:hypothetical protein
MDIEARLVTAVARRKFRDTTTPSFKTRVLNLALRRVVNVLASLWV